VKRCACCGRGDAASTPDARLPFLAVAACWPCRDLIASWCGWTRTIRYWIRGDQRVSRRDLVRGAAA